MTSSPKILVLGATGATGYPVCVELAKRKIPFRAALHTIGKSESITKLGSNIEVAEVDISKPESLEKALSGIENVFMLLPPTPANWLLAPSIVSAFKKAGVKYVAKLSASGTEDNGKSSSKLAGEHAKIEDLLRKEGIKITSLRPTSFYTNLSLRQGFNIKNHSKIEMGVNLDSKLNWVDPRDIGEVAAICLENPTKYEGKNIEICGPDTITCVEVAEMISQELGRKITFIPMSDEQLRAQARSWGLNEEGVELWSDMWRATRDRNSPFSNDAEYILGRKLRPLRDFIHESRNVFL